MLLRSINWFHIYRLVEAALNPLWLLTFTAAWLFYGSFGLILVENCTSCCSPPPPCCFSTWDVPKIYLSFPIFHYNFTGSFDVVGISFPVSQCSYFRLCFEKHPLGIHTVLGVCFDEHVTFRISTIQSHNLPHTLIDNAIILKSVDSVYLDSLSSQFWLIFS